MLLWFLGLAALIALALFFEERHGLLSVGSRAPDFTSTTSSGSRISLHEFAGKKNVVLYFYPNDFTAGCTAEACSMRDGYGELSTLDAVVLGVSGDGSLSHERFRSRYDLPFELVTDSNRSVGRAYGAERLGGLVNLPKRITYVIDKRGVIRLVAHHEVDIGDHLADVIQTLKTVNEQR